MQVIILRPIVLTSIIHVTRLLGIYTLLLHNIKGHTSNEVSAPRKTMDKTIDKYDFIQ